MPQKSLSNLFLATGRAAASGGMNFVNSLPNSPRSNGDSFGCYVLNLNDEYKDFNGSTIYDNYRTFTWVANLDSANSPNLLNDLVGKSTSILLGNVFDGENNAKPSGLSITNTSFTYGSTWVSASFRLNNSQSVASYPLEGQENAWFEADVSMSHAADNYFNDVQTLSVARVKVRPSLIGQGSPSVPPTIPSSPTITHPSVTLGSNFADCSVSAGWFGLSGSVEIQWSTDSGFSSVFDTGPTGQLFTNDDPNYAATIYCRARVTSPYTGPWSDVSSVYWEDPRPDL